MIEARLLVVIGRTRATRAAGVEFGGDGVDNALHLYNNKLSKMNPNRSHKNTYRPTSLRGPPH